MDDYYKLLGVDRGASDDEIKKAYRKMAHKHHPDKQGGNENKFKEINEAYQVLSDKTKRQQYDQFGKTFDQGGFSGGQGQGFEGFSAQGGPASGWDFSNFDFQDIGLDDIFSDVFGGAFGRKGRTGKKAGGNIQVDLEISFEEMVKGTGRTINLYKSVICDVCRGSGDEQGAKKETCPTCHGSGQIRRNTQSFFGSFSQVTTCPTCHGSGEAHTQKCKKCGGDGRVKENESIGIDVPAGIQDGQTLSMEGRGEVGELGGPSGDLYINIHVTPHPKFRREKNNIVSTEYISFSQAALGDKVYVDTIDGQLKMKIPAGTQSGEVFKIKGEGVPFLGKRQKGDHLIKIQVKTPKNIPREQRELIERLKEIE
ncbi:MAG: molecular chaperone DnaJ [bacterium]|nr:molecular chaperone DnaJ [bacterium]